MKQVLGVAATLLGLGAVAAHAAPTFTSTVFATAPAGATGPDSVALGAGSLWIAYDGGALSSDGSQPAGFTTVVRYSTAGAVQSTFQIAGDVDGLKYNPASGMVWAIQNQDANSHLTLINPLDNTTTGVNFANISATQGYDDVAFTAAGTFLSTTNPSAATSPTLQKVVDGTTPIQATTIATAGTAGTNALTGASGFVPAKANTDSLKVAPNGDLVQTTGNRDTLAFIHNAGTATQSISYLTLTNGGAPVSGLDDSLYLTASAGTIYAAASGSNTVYAISYTGITPGTLIASVGSLSEIAFIDPSTGSLSPFVTGLSGIHGLDVAAVPEPATLTLLSSGLFGLLALRRKRA